jgi:hypothetical protein
MVLTLGQLFYHHVGVGPAVMSALKLFRAVTLTSEVGL